MTTNKKVMKWFDEMMNDKRHIIFIRKDYFQIAPGAYALDLQLVIDSYYRKKKDANGYFNLSYLMKKLSIQDDPQFKSENGRETKRGLKFLEQKGFIKLNKTITRAKLYPRRIEKALDAAYKALAKELKDEKEKAK